MAEKMNDKEVGISKFKNGFPVCPPPPREQFNRAVAFVRTFKSEEEWHSHCQKIHEQERLVRQKWLDDMDKKEALFTVFLWSAVILIILCVEFFK